jgi:hypothetical protein
MEGNVWLIIIDGSPNAAYETRSESLEDSYEDCPCPACQGPAWLYPSILMDPEKVRAIQTRPLPYTPVLEVD